MLVYGPACEAARRAAAVHQAAYGYWTAPPPPTSALGLSRCCLHRCSYAAQGKGEDQWLPEGWAAEHWNLCVERTRRLMADGVGVVWDREGCWLDGRAISSERGVRSPPAEGSQAPQKVTAPPSASLRGRSRSDLCAVAGRYSQYRQRHGTHCGFPGLGQNSMAEPWQRKTAATRTDWQCRK